MNIGIIGQGFVGNAIFQKFKSFYNVYTFDLIKSKSNCELDQMSKNCSIIFICLPTPMNQNGSCNIDNLLSVLTDLESRSYDQVVVIKSTIIPGTTDKLNKSFPKIDILHNPEFLTEKNAVKDFENQNRIILGGSDEANSKISKIYKLVFPDAVIIKTDSKYAEMVKYLTNSFLATKVSFANEMYQIAEALGIDYAKVIKYAKLDKRLGYSHWNVPGHDGYYGFGGICLPKDLNALIHLSNELGLKPHIINAVKKKNDEVRNYRDWKLNKGRSVI